jgi:hypothetical protein
MKIIFEFRFKLKAKKIAWLIKLVKILASFSVLFWSSKELIS